MFPINSSLVRIFQGNPIREPAEKLFLNLIIADFEAAKTPALVFMNFFAGPKSLRIDSLVITKSSVCLVEIKGYSSAVRGKHNGMWEIRKIGEGNHVWEKIEGQNGYEETLAHKMALSDDMHRFAREKLSIRDEKKDKYYKLFHAWLCFVPDIPPDSDLPESNYKVATLGYRSGFDTILSKPLRPSWTFEEWQEFASWMSLEAVPLDKLWHDGADAINLLEEYQQKFSFRARDKWVPTAIFNNETRIGRESIKDCLLGAQSCLIEGPSGMGKSCLAQSIAAEIGCTDRLVIEFNAGYFNGNLEERLDDSVGAHVASTLNQLLAYGNAFGKGLVLLIDGWNECKPDFRRLLGQQLDKMVNRHKATLLVTSQFVPKEITTPLEIFKLGILERADKLAIAGLDESSERKLSDLIDIIRNGIDAKIIGEIAAEIQGSVSRAELFDRFIRKRIGRIDPTSTTVFDAMTLAAHSMHNDLSASLPITQLHLLEAVAKPRMGLNRVI
jgi:hypothetical protein